MNHVNQAKNQFKAAVVFFKIQFLFSGVVSVWIMFARAKVGVDQKARPKFWLSFSNFNTVISLGCLLARDTKKKQKNLNWISCTQELKNRETSACCNSFRQHQMIFQKIWKRGPNSERPSYCLILWNVSKGVSRLTAQHQKLSSISKNELSLRPVIFLVSHVTCTVDPWC